MENYTADPHGLKQQLGTTHIDSLSDRYKNMKIEGGKCNNEIKNKNLVEKRYVEGYSFEDEEEEEEEEEDLEEALLMQMGYWKPEPKEVTPLPLPKAEVKLVSAMKGSREKEGIEIEEKRVWWAPDVYDPVPKSPEDFYTGKVIPQKSESKKGGGKNKQKMGKGGGGGGKGGKEKDKKQARKYGGSASRGFSSLDDDETGW